MEGDIANLPRLIEIRDRYDAWLMVDEAHSLGVLGAHGRGFAEHFGIDPRQIDMIVGTMSKTLGASGGFIAGRKSMIDWLRFTLPAFVFSVGLSPALAAAVREALAILTGEPWRVERPAGEFAADPRRVQKQRTRHRSGDRCRRGFNPVPQPT